MGKTYFAQSGHTLFVEKIDRSELPPAVLANNYSEGFETFYSVKNWDKDGMTFFYLAKDGNSSKEICAFYPKGGFWSSFGRTIIDAINGAQRDGWMYA